MDDKQAQKIKDCNIRELQAVPDMPKSLISLMEKLTYLAENSEAHNQANQNKNQELIKSIFNS